MMPFRRILGGVLASSRTAISRDDRGARIVKVIDNLSTYQIRTHYLIYSAISELFSNGANSFDLPGGRAEMQLFIPIQGYAEAMDFIQKEWNNPQILNHIFHGLSTDGLIEGGWAFGSQKCSKHLATFSLEMVLYARPLRLALNCFFGPLGMVTKTLTLRSRRIFHRRSRAFPNQFPIQYLPKADRDESIQLYSLSQGIQHAKRFHDRLTYLKPNSDSLTTKAYW